MAGVVETDMRQVLAHEDLLGEFAHKCVLVTGASGLIGSALLRTFDAANIAYDLGIEAIGAARSEGRMRAALRDASERIELLSCDGFDRDVACDWVFHAACPTASRYLAECPVESIGAMLDGTKAMLELAKANGATVVYLSSMEEYGVPYSEDEVMTEDKVGMIDHLRPRSCYPEGKRMCECLCACYAAEYGVHARIVRLAQTFGAGMSLDDGRMPMQFARSAAEGRDIRLKTRGRSVSNFCYLTDAITGMLTVATRGRDGEAYNVCNDAESRTVLEVAQLVASSVRGGGIGVSVTDDTDAAGVFAPENTMRLDSGKLRALGWSAEVGMGEGYERLISYVREAASRLSPACQKGLPPADSPIHAAEGAAAFAGRAMSTLV